MGIREEFKTSQAIHDEAVALYEAAKADFEALQAVIQRSLGNGVAPSADELKEKERAKARLHFAQVQLTQRKPTG